jgi:hypothetical protein
MTSMYLSLCPFRASSHAELHQQKTEGKQMRQGYMSVDRVTRVLTLVSKGHSCASAGQTSAWKPGWYGLQYKAELSKSHIAID